MLVGCFLYARKDDSVIYENPNCRNVRGSHILFVSCGYCKTDIAEYQKEGRGNLLRMHINRIKRSSIDMSQPKKALICPNCKERLGTRITLKRGNKQVYRMIRSAFNTRERDY